ncbi:MAG: transposase [Candidatus Brocadiia bacterium]|nr:transposase [Candidatus Brocadiia bacterium]
MKERHRKTIKHCNLSGHAHELTFSCYQRLPLLSVTGGYDWLIEAIRRAAEALNYGVLAYVLMPEHVHLIVLPNEGHYSVSSFLKRVKQSVSRRARAWLMHNDPGTLQRLTAIRQNGTESFHFWMPGPGFDRNVTDDRTLKAMIGYIHENPVRRGLAARAVDWQWSSAGWHEQSRCGPLAVAPLRFS